MAADGLNISEDAEMSECEGDKVVTMMDVLQEQQDFEEDANAVLGASDDKNCTYSKGYIKRQALYACLTCCAEAKTNPTKRAGLCLACSLNCHENHELIELYTKRNFRCDCGNPKFNSHPCQFTSDKNDLNEENIYNQNFSGLYCTCQRPYPDPESTLEDDMIQCIICEDWLHASHLEATVPANDQYSEMVCKGCMEKNEFLHDYSLFAVNVETEDVDIISANGDTKSSDSHCNGDLEKDILVNGIAENKSHAEPANEDVEMNENKENTIDSSETDKVVESVAAETSLQTKQDGLNNIESTESKSEENGKPDNVNDIEMELDTENKEVEQEEQSIKPTESTAESNITQENTETSNDTAELQSELKPNAAEITSELKPDAAEMTSEVEPEQNNKTATDDREVSTDKKDDDKIDSEPEKPDRTLREQTETEEHMNETSTTEENGESNNISNDKIVEDAAIEENLIESNEQTDNNKKIEHSVTTIEVELPNDTINQSGDSSESDKSSSDDKTVTAGKVEVPDTSQCNQAEEINADDKTDSVLDTIDELLETANEEKEGGAAEQNECVSTESMDILTTEESNYVETSKTEEPIDTSLKTNTDDEISNRTSQNQPSVRDNSDDSGKQDIDDKTSADVEINDSFSQSEPLVNESKVDNVELPTIDAESKNIDTKAIDSKTETSVDENKDYNESPKYIEENYEVSDTVNKHINEENEALNETENELLEPIHEIDSTNEKEPSDDLNKVPNLTENTSEHKRKLSIDLTEDIYSKKAKIECRRPRGVKRVNKGATFWPSNFRQKLCTCGECISMYNDLKVLFLTDPEDTVFAYESLGKENVAGGASQYEKGLQALSTLDRIQQINALTEYNKMRDKLLDFLKSFKDRKEIVKEEDIKAFFAGMKPRREPDGVYFCR